jgi:hypothetical protein
MFSHALPSELQTDLDETRDDKLRKIMSIHIDYGLISLILNATVFMRLNEPLGAYFNPLTEF